MTVERINGFKRDGYIIFDINNTSAMVEIADLVQSSLSHHLNGKKNLPLEQIHQEIEANTINNARIDAYSSLNSEPTVLEKYFSLFKEVVFEIVGTELACQAKINLSIQMPNDKTSQLPLHTDTIGGQSKYEVVAWLPLTRAFETNAMYVFSLDDSQEMMNALPDYHETGMNRLFSDFESRKKFIELDPGQALIFSSNLMHGNVVNQTTATRVSLNTRYKSLFSPYNDLPNNEKRIGGFYKPLSLSPVTELALKIKEPETGF